MPLILPVTGQVSPEADAALTRLIEAHLRTHGVVLDGDQVRRLKQEGPVFEFLDAIVALGGRVQDEARRPAARSDVEPGERETTAPPLLPQDESPSNMPHSTGFDPGPLPPGATVPMPLPDPEADAIIAARPAAGDDESSPAPDLTPAAVDVDPLPPEAPVDALLPSPTVALETPAPTAPIVRLRMPNGTVGTPYDQVVDLATVSGIADLRAVEIDQLDGTGLSFDAARSRLHGTPVAEAGKSREFVFPMKLESAIGTRSKTEAGEITLYVNPNPRSLWKEIDPDPGLPFQKPHRRSADIEGGGLRAVVSSVRGRSHANTGTFREDDFHLGHDASGAWTVIAVSDGAGSAKLSRRGSQIATRESVESLADALGAVDVDSLTSLPQDRDEDLASDAKSFETVRLALRDAIGRAAFQASKAVRNEAMNLKEDEKALSATLLLAAIRKHGNGLLVASYWIGDGAAVLFNPDTTVLETLGEADSGEYSGQTRFLLSSEFVPDPWKAITRRFRCVRVPAGAVLVLMSDGVSDPKFGTDNALKDEAQWKRWWHEDFLGNGVDLARDNPALKTQIEEYLGFWSQGEHDDRTLALVY